MRNYADLHCPTSVSVVEDRSLLAPYFWSRLAMAGPVGPMWFDLAPPGYPWSMLMVPVNITTKGVSRCVYVRVCECVSMYVCVYECVSTCASAM